MLQKRYIPAYGVLLLWYSFPHMKDILQGVVFVGLFLIPFLPLYVEDSFFFPFITGKNFAFRIIIEIVFASWVLLALYEPKYRPKFSWILAGFAALLGVMAVSNALGQYPLQSFWSNFERMDGYITLVHVFLLLLVAGSVFTSKKIWSYFFHVSAAIALLVALHGLAQYFGVIAGPEQSRVRIDSRLGNAAYMAIYMLFHIFLVFWLFVRTKVTLHRVLYALTAMVFAVTLLYTGTRGTFLGFVGGSAAMVAYIAIFGRAYPELRKAAIGLCIAGVVLAAGFWAVRDAQFVQDNNALSRIANIDLAEDLAVRSTIWGMAFDGFKERPLLGWGQSNFNFVFNDKYEPSLYAQESWFDRSHNIMLDWLVTGGILGFIAYFSIFFAGLYYLIVLPFFKKEDELPFNVLERGVLIGLFAGYLIHNAVVFDNIISYIFYGCVLALIHAHVSTKIPKVEKFTINQQMIGQFVAPIVILLAGASVYFLNAPGMGAASDIIDAMQAQSIEGRLREFDSALRRNSFADQEIVEQLAQQAMSIVRNPQITEEERKAIVMRSELELLRMIEEKPGDARLHAFLSSFYRAIGALPQAQEQAAIARELSPNKQALIIEQGIVEIQLNDLPKAEEYFKTAFELEESNTQARILYAALLAAQNKFEEVDIVLGEDYFDDFAQNDFALSMVDQSRNREYLARMFEERIAAHPEVAQNRASLAFIYYETGEIDRSIAVLQEAALAIPQFAPTAECFIGNLESGAEPAEGCQ